MRPKPAELALSISTVLWPLLAVQSYLVIPSLLQLFTYSTFLSSSPLLLCSAFNLEVRLPLVKRGVKGSYFGYSVAQHVIQEDASRKLMNEPIILVGAPRAASGPGANRSGLVYRCPFTTYQEDCTPLPIDHDGSVVDPSTSKDDQWLGVAVKSQGAGGYVVACAHRYVLKGADHVWGQGICYSLTQYLDYQRAWEPCYNRPVAKAHEQFGYCQAGTSVDISPENDIVIGTPGPYTWRGTVFTNSIRFGIRDDKSWYSGPLLESTSPVDKYSYLGMAVTSGKFLTGDRVSYVAGAPRSAGTGQVIFYSKAKPDSIFSLELILDGEQFASSFGYSIAALDLNGDRKLDLAVGAPFYYGKSEGGAVYVYLNSPSSLHNNTPAYKLTGKLESRFGFSLASLGDINRDGLQDLVVGAPYEESRGAVYIYLGSREGLKTSAVQVIHGSDLPVQAGISATFGYSLSGGIDMDANGYPDLIVGAYESDAAVLLRARPIIDIITSVKGQLKNIDPNEKHCSEDPSVKQVCFSFSACFRFNSSLSIGVVKLSYKIEAETFTGKKYYRVKFATTADTHTPNIIEKDIVIRDQIQDDFCTRELVYLKDKSDIQNAIPFKLTYSLVQAEPRFPHGGEPVPDINRYPILNQEEAHRIFEAHFLKDCGSNDICESDLVVTSELHLPRDKSSNTSILNLGEENVNLTLKVVNRNEPAYEANVYITHSASLSYVSRRILDGEQVECLPINKTLLRCELGNPFPKRGKTELELKFNPRAILDDEQSINFAIEVNTTSRDISPHKNKIELTATVVRTAELEIKGSAEPDQVFYGGEVTGESSMIWEDDVGSLLVHTYVVTNRGPWQVRRLEVVIDWPFETQSKRDHGKWLLYLMETQVQGNGYCEPGPNLNPLKLRRRSENTQVTTSSPYVKSQQQKERRKGSKGSIKVKRDVIEPLELRNDGKLEPTVEMSCIENTAKCIKFSCFLSDLKANTSAVIKLRGRLWNSTFIEDYAHGVSLLKVYSNAVIKIDSALDIRQTKTDNDATFVFSKVYPDTALLPPREAPLWAIILAIILGVLLLVVLIAILWRLGFFERKKYGQLPGSEETTVDKPFESQAFN